MKVNPTKEVYLKKSFSSDPEELKATINSLVDSYNTQISRISIETSFSSYIAQDVVIAAGATANIQHFLGVIPKWRIILRQTGNGVITDVTSGWTAKIISLKNNGAESVTISVMIVRE
jgi:hypothetical protein